MCTHIYTNTYTHTTHTHGIDTRHSHTAHTHDTHTRHTDGTHTAHTNGTPTHTHGTHPHTHGTHTHTRHTHTYICTCTHLRVLIFLCGRMIWGNRPAVRIIIGPVWYYTCMKTSDLDYEQVTLNCATQCIHQGGPGVWGIRYTGGYNLVNVISWKIQYPYLRSLSKVNFWYTVHPI